MDEEKKKHLEDLRKQIDPEVLAKMADYLGNEDGNATASNTDFPQSSSDSAADLLRDRRAQQFQERVAKRKRENTLAPNDQEIKAEEQKRTVFILSSTGIWSRIVENQFKSWGFSDTFLFESFDSLFRHILDTLQQDESGKFAVAVALNEIRNFILSWKNIRKGLADQQKSSLLDRVVVFLIVESIKQVQDPLVQIIGENRIISITDEFILNKEKINKEFMATETLGFRI